MAASPSFLRDLREDLARTGIVTAIRTHDTKTLFGWIVSALSYQGISDTVATSYMETHGRVSASAVRSAVHSSPCPKLDGYWTFESCDYRKDARRCGEPRLMSHCGLPDLPMRNGRLNQMAASLFLFIRDVMAGDVVGWLDERIREARDPSAVVDAMRGIYGVSDKVLSMLLSSLCLADPDASEHWQEIGASFVVIDTLVHNHLHRTGMLSSRGAEHPYGIACYRPNGCADILRSLAGHIDASQFSADQPRYFPRFVQHAIWRFCAQEGLNVCNGNQIDDRQTCANLYCLLRANCRKHPLQAKNVEKPRFS